ncbi:helix-turn-helix domain-containing protein [Microbulbifer sp. GL-2]|uniref:winged helix-turn-helix transcriptional regulator n=1 Tax=Microbulbifer sp. GL-2 TaxID=2591606 RepID=UPI001162C1EA|nr:helix-turn-helix domain-containing protein [Microbulbifer sp. GL-2]BBM03126.1 transcriptional regulator [Microbulbifer sp. GL-2]
MREKKPAVQCAIEEALSVIGDRWSLLIVRDVMRGVNRFDSLQESLQISRNILTQRLNTLEEAGILVKTPIKPGARRMLYNATPKCIALVPTLVSLIDWSARWSEKPDTRWARVIDKRTGEPVTVDLVGKDGEPVSLLDLDLTY